MYERVRQGNSRNPIRFNEIYVFVKTKFDQIMLANFMVLLTFQVSVKITPKINGVSRGIFGLRDAGDRRLAPLARTMGG